MEIYCLDIRAFSPHWEEALALVSGERRALALRQPTEDALLRSLAGGVLLRRFLGDAPLSYGPHGKPFLPGGPGFSLSHGGELAVLALDDRNNVLTVTQYRYVFGKTLLELPAGKLDPGEDPVTGALRELKEETGAVPDIFLPLGRIIPAPGCYGEVLHLFLARGLHMEDQHLDPDEFLNVERIPFEEMVHRCLTGEIEDAKTVAAVLKAKIQLNL